MFEVGKTYDFRVLEGGDEVTFSGVVETYEHPLIKLKDTEEVTISFGDLDEEGEVFGVLPAAYGRVINVTSPSFVSAVRQRD